MFLWKPNPISYVENILWESPEYLLLNFERTINKNNAMPKLRSKSVLLLNMMKCLMNPWFEKIYNYYGKNNEDHLAVTDSRLTIWHLARLHHRSHWHWHGVGDSWALCESHDCIDFFPIHILCMYNDLISIVETFFLQIVRGWTLHMYRPSIF